MTSTAPAASASSVTEAARRVALEMITVGSGLTGISWRRKLTPSRRGISMSSVITSGCSASIMPIASSALAAAPTTWISGSPDRPIDSTLRITAESSTISTRTRRSVGSVIPVPSG